MRDVLLIILGVCTTLLAGMFCEQVLVWMLRPAHQGEPVTLLPVIGECPSLERQLRWQYFCLQSQSYFGRRGVRLVIVDCGASGNTLRMAQLFCRDKTDAIVCTPEGLRRIIGNDTIYKAVALVLY
ncbi:MAG: hypothetical protein ACK5L0_04395 [Candidatus Fimivivens sp.]